MKELPITIYTDHEISKIICYNFAKGSNSLMCHVDNFKDVNKTIATYGLLRGTGDLLRNVKNFYYIDHGYFKQSKRVFENKRTSIKDLDGYFRIVYNKFIHNGEGSYPDDRLKKLNLKFSNIKKNGEYIILSEPSEVMKNFYNVHTWVNDTIGTIQKFTDRKLIIHNKFSKIPLDNLLDKAWAFVSLQSTAGFKAMIKGVPAYFTDPTMSNINKIQDIEKNNIDYNIFNNLAYGQWTIKEIASGEAWKTLTKEK
tara:strand:- start:1042 stop:1803 length:762 start_codon:yes stop_codon:yes gene_type:complete